MTLEIEKSHDGGLDRAGELTLKDERLPMSTAHAIVQPIHVEAVVAPTGDSQRRVFHRIKEVRHQQGCSVRRAAQMLKCDAQTVRREEDESTDLPISRLLEWQKVLEVPLSELLVEADEPLSPPVLQRARLVRLMKTAMAVEEKAASPQQKRLALTLIEQLKEIMPELDGVTPWNSVGQRRAQAPGGRVYPDFDRSRMSWYE